MYETWRATRLTRGESGGGHDPGISLLVTTFEILIELSPCSEIFIMVGAISTFRGFHRGVVGRGV